jgi:rfaE bifunctional protein kinase chain/domain
MAGTGWGAFRTAPGGGIRLCTMIRAALHCAPIFRNFEEEGERAMFETLDVEWLDRIIARAASVRVAVVGDLMLDVYLTGAVHRISPEAPVPVVRVTQQRSALGGAANVAANVAQIGASCDLIGVVGTDREGDDLQSGVEAVEGGAVRTRFVRSTERPTTTKTRVMARHQQVVRFDREEDGELPVELVAQLCDLIRESVHSASVLVLEDYDKGVLSPTSIGVAISAAREVGIPVVVDPKFRNALAYRGATVFKPNSLELTSAMGMPPRLDDDFWLEESRSRFGCEHLLVTCGEEGMILKSEGAPAVRVPAVAREVYDVSGAGDTVTAFLAVAIATGANIVEAAMLANLAAGVEVGKPGVATVCPSEIRDLIVAAPSEAIL